MSGTQSRANDRESRCVRGGRSSGSPAVRSSNSRTLCDSALSAPVLVHQGEDARAPLGAQGADGGSLECVEPVQRRLLCAEVTARQPADDTEQDDEADVDDRDRRAVEVVHVLGDELADLVDEEPEADTAADRGDRLRSRAEEGDHDEQTRQEEQASPEHVGDVELPSTDLRVAGRSEKATREDDGRDRADEQQRQMLMQVVAAGRTPQSDSRFLAARHATTL